MEKERIKKYTLVFAEEVIYGELAGAHAEGRIEIHDPDKHYFFFLLLPLLPRKMYQRLRNKLQGLKF